MPRYYTPGIYYERVDLGRKGISAVRMDIPGFVGMAEKGPLDTPVKLDSWGQYQSVFGGLIPQSYLAYTVRGFFVNRGETCYVVRIADIAKAGKAEATLRDKNGNPTLKIVARSEGQWGNQIRVSLKTAGGGSGEFNLTVSLGDRIREVFKNLSVNPGHSRYAPSVINEKERSNLITIEDLNRSSPVPAPPDIATLQKGLHLSLGADGIQSIEKTDLTGDRGSLKKRGLRCYEDINEVSMICIPDIMVQPVKVVPPLIETEPLVKTIDPCLKPEPETTVEPVPPPYRPGVNIESPPQFEIGDIHFVQHKMVEHCEMMKDRVAILDPPFNADLKEILEWRKNWDSKFAALYYPWIRVEDHLRLDNQLTRLVPPSGHAAGIYARSELERGVHWAPANQEVLGARDVAVVITQAEQDLLNPEGINCLRVFPGRGVVVWGARTVSSDASWVYISVRRLLIMIEKSVAAAMHWSVFEINDYHLRMAIIVSVSSFLEELWKRGALAGAVPAEAFVIKCDGENNPQSVVDAGKVITEIGVAPSIPGEFIVFKIGKVEDRMEVME